MISDAEASYLAEILEDCSVILGPGVEIIDLGREDVASEAAASPDARLFVVYRLGGIDRRSEGRGETVVAAHADLRGRLAVDRLRYGFASVIEPR